MRWTPGGRGNIEDLRGRSGGMRAVPLGIGGMLLLLVLSWFTGIDFLSLIGNGGGSAQIEETTGTSGTVAATPEEERTVDMVDAVMEDTQQTWEQLLSGRYQRTRAVLFRSAVQSTCGMAESAVGPFYCPADRKVYLDLSFFNDLHQRFRAPGEFAQAYVLAHEVGHHVQTLIGVESQVRQRQQSDPRSRNEYSVRMELQADCFAGVWAHHATTSRDLLDQSDIAEALNAATAIGDDRLQRASQGRVVPDAFTHGSAQQREAWLRRGMKAGTPEACDTFSAQSL